MDQLSSGSTQNSGVEVLAFRVWGRFAATRLADGVDVTPRGRKARALLAYLLIEGKAVPRDVLAGLLWSERGQAQAHASLRQCLQELRDFAPMLQIDRLRLKVEGAAVRTDFDAMIAAAEGGDAEGLAALLDGGRDLLEDLDGLDPAFDQWLRAIRATRTGALLATAQAHCRQAVAEGRMEAAATLSRSLLAIDPLDEGIARLAMEAGHRAGRQESVQRVYDRLVADLKEELGVAPSADTQALHQQLVADAGAALHEPGSSVVAETSAPAAKLATAGTTIRWWRRWRVLAAAAGFLLLLAAGALVVPRLLDGGGADAEPVSLAVLPFRNLSAGDNYFAEGLAEEILAQLARDPQFRVAGRTSSWLLKHRGSDPRDIGRRLDVDYVLEGSVRRAEDRVHIDVALVGTHDGMRLWSQAFQGSLDDIFAIQNEIGRGVAASLRRRLVNAAPVAGPLATNGEVYHLYLTARRLIRTRDPQNARTAIVLLRRAVRLDPNYAPAWSSLGEALRFDWIDPEDHSEGRRYVERALALAPDLAEAHAALGLIEGSTPRGRAHLERAVRLDPNNAEAWLWLSTARGRMFDFDGGLAAIRRAAEIDPLWERTNQVADAAWSQGFHAEALRHDQRLIATHPEESHREMARGRIAARSGDWSGFVLHFLRAAQLDSDVQFDARFRVNSVLIMLGLPFDETVFAGMEASLMVSLAKDELPPLAEFLDRLESADRYWRYTWINVMASRAFLNQGRSADLLVLYDRAFESFAVIETAEWDDAFELQAPLIAIALREGGRHAEAERILGLVGRRLAPACRRVRLPADFWVHCARIWAVRGNREAALTALERAAAMRWPDGFEPFPEWMPRPVPAEDPAFRSLRDEPRFQRIDARIRVHLARERRELQAALARRPQT